MIATSLAVLTLSASSALSPFSSLIHLHAHAPNASVRDTRITVTLRNPSRTFEDVKIEGQRYTVLPQQTLRVKAPVGTVILADSSTGGLHRGEVVTALTPELQNQTILLQ